MKPNCDNCTKLQISELDDSCPNEEVCGVIGCTITSEVKSWVDIHGCLMNPGAREYLMKDVIDELERLKHITPSHETELTHVTIDWVISLIKEGVKK